jgi:hypothetical protein
VQIFGAAEVCRDIGIAGLEKQAHKISEKNWELLDW